MFSEKKPENRIYLGRQYRFWENSQSYFNSGNFKNNIYQYNDTTYHLSRHGFARDMVFDLIDKRK
jgi:galactose mutarotase-like enzyme